jgi:hypothetical protein
MGQLGGAGAVATSAERRRLRGVVMTGNAVRRGGDVAPRSMAGLDARNGTAKIVDLLIGAALTLLRSNRGLEYLERTGLLASVAKASRMRYVRRKQCRRGTPHKHEDAGLRQRVGRRWCRNPRHRRFCAALPSRRYACCERTGKHEERGPRLSWRRQK